MNALPFTYLSHYYHKDRPPFLSISSLGTGEALRLAAALQIIPGIAYERFKNPLEYLRDRHYTEDWLLEQFIAQGGRPMSRYPYYFVLGESSFLERAYIGNFLTLRLSLDDIDDMEISFTYPDSMVSRYAALEKKPDYYNPVYHGKVFTKDGFASIIHDYGFPDKCCKHGMEDQNEFFIEAQVWNERYVQECF